MTFGGSDPGLGRLTACYGSRSRRNPALPPTLRTWSAETGGILQTPTRSPTAWDGWRQMWRGPERPEQDAE